MADSEIGTPVPAPEPTLTAQTIGGMRWTYFGTAATVLLQLIYTAVISRLLDPATFGLVALAGLFLRFGSYFAQLGFSSAVINLERVDDSYLRTANTLSAISGATFAILVVLLAPVFADVVDEPRLIGVTQAMAFTLLLASLVSTPMGLLRRRMQFRKAAVAEVISYTIGFPIVGVFLAIQGFGVWSLVLAALTQGSVLLVLMSLFARNPLQPTIDRRASRDLFAFGGRVSIIGFLEFLTGSLDTFAVGRYAGASAVGQYNRAIFLVAVPTQHLTAGFNKVLFPSFSKIKSDTARSARVFLSITAIATATILPLCLVVAVLSRPLILTLLGTQWEIAADILPIIAVAVALDMTAHLGAVMAEARGQLNQKLVIQSTALIATIGFLGIAVARGGALRELALAWAAAQLLRHGFYLALMLRSLDLPKRQVATHYAQAILLSMLTSLAAWAALAALEATAFWVQLLAGAVGAAVVYTALILFFPGLRVREELRARGVLQLLFRGDRISSLQNDSASVRK